MRTGHSRAVAGRLTAESVAPSLNAGHRYADRLMKFAAIAVAFLLVLSVRLYFIGNYAIDLPYSDQWDSEAWTWLRPFQTSGINWGILFAPHNEHRVALVRIVSLLLFAANDNQWDNLVSCTFNAFFVASMCALALRALQKRATPAAAAVALLVLAACCVPCGYENLVVGFQAQFYFLIALTVSGVWLAASRPVNVMRTLWLGLIALTSLFSMATGLFTSAALATAVILRRRAAGSPWLNCLPSLAILGATAFLGYLLLVPVSSHAALHSQSLSEWFSGVFKTGSWPLPGSWFCFTIVWLPSLVGIISVIRERDADPLAISAAALAAWTALQIGSIVYGRGHGMASPASRYTDVLALTIVVNTYFCVRFLAARPAAARARLVTVAALLWLVAILIGYAAQGAAGFVAMKEFSVSRKVQAENVRRYILSGDRASLENAQPWNLPYPDGRRLRMMLDDATIRDILPAGVRPAVPVAKVFRDSFDRLADAAAGETRQPGVVSVDLHSRFPYLLVEVSRPAGHELVLDLVPRNGSGTRHQILHAVNNSAWSEFVVAVPSEDFSLVARDTIPGPTRIALRRPIEMGRLSLWTARLLEASPILLWTSSIAACVLALLFGLLRLRSQGGRSPDQTRGWAANSGKSL